MPDTKFEFDSFSIFGDIRHKISLLGRERVIEFGYLAPENGFNLKGVSFYVQNRSP